MTKTNQTAVEYLLKEMSEILGSLKTNPMQDLLIVDAINKAKQMEKEQKADGWNQAICAVEKDKWESFEQYYKETYGK